MTGRDAAFGSQGKVFAQTLRLAKIRLVVGIIFHRAVAHEHRRHVRIAHGPARDGRRRGYVPVQQCRRYRKRFRVVLESERLLIRRQHRLGVHVHRDQIPHGVGVFGAIQTMQAGGPARVHVSRSRAVDSRFQPTGNRIVGRVIRARHARRRHRTASQLHDDLFPRLRRVGDVLGIRAIQHEIRGLQLLVMTGDAVLIHQFARGSTVAFCPENRKPQRRTAPDRPRPDRI